MSKAEFDEFMRDYHKKEKSIDWVKRKNDWISSVSNFYEDVKLFMKEYIDREDATISMLTKSVSEEFVGQYDIQVLDLNFAMKSVRFTPVGANIVGAKGRIDMSGPNGERIFLLLEKYAKYQNYEQGSNGFHQAEDLRLANGLKWVVCASAPRGMVYKDFCEDTFFDALTEVI